MNIYLQGDPIAPSMKSCLFAFCHDVTEYLVS